MQLKIRHQLQEELELPIAYHHILQGIIYHALENVQIKLGDFFHNDGFSYHDRHYKLFTFGLLEGKYRIKDKKIIFFDEIEWEIRSPEMMLMRVLERSIKEQGIYFGRKHLVNMDVILSNDTIETTELIVDMISPITVYSTDEIDKTTYYYMPDEIGFYQQIDENFIRKYQSVYGVIPDEHIFAEPIKVSNRDRYVTKFKGIYITAWKGRYRLIGERKSLDFLYQAGLGSKNSQGFGMFREI